MIKTTHPSGTTFQYVPKYSVVKVMGKHSAILHNGKEAGVLITDSKGNQVFRPNSYYKNIKPLAWSEVSNGMGGKAK